MWTLGRTRWLPVGRARVGRSYTVQQLMLLALLSWSGPVLEVGVLLGLMWRRRLGRAWSLPVFLSAVLAADMIVALWPALNTWRFWLSIEVFHTLLLLALVLEVSFRIARSLPGPALTLSLLVPIVIAATGALWRDAPRQYVLFELVPRLLAGTAGLYIGTFLVQAFFRVPVDPLHKAVLLGLSPWMLLYAATWGRVTRADAVAMTGAVNAAMFAFALLVLLEAAWRREDGPTVRLGLLRFLWPWRR